MYWLVICIGSLSGIAAFAALSVGLWWWSLAEEANLAARSRQHRLC
jgi:hypothetical protein